MGTLTTARILASMSESAFEDIIKLGYNPVSIADTILKQIQEPALRYDEVKCGIAEPFKVYSFRVNWTLNTATSKIIKIEINQ